MTEEEAFVGQKIKKKQIILHNFIMEFKVIGLIRLALMAKLVIIRLKLIAQAIIQLLKVITFVKQLLIRLIQVMQFTQVTKLNSQQQV